MRPLNWNWPRLAMTEVDPEAASLYHILILGGSQSIWTFASLFSSLVWLLYPSLSPQRPPRRPTYQELRTPSPFRSRRNLRLVSCGLQPLISQTLLASRQCLNHDHHLQSSTHWDCQEFSQYLELSQQAQIAGFWTILRPQGGNGPNSPCQSQLRRQSHLHSRP